MRVIAELKRRNAFKAGFACLQTMLAKMNPMSQEKLDVIARMDEEAGS